MGPGMSDLHILVQCDGPGIKLTLSPGQAGCVDWHMSSALLKM